MKKKLIAELRKMDDVEFKTLYLSMQIADSLRSFMKDYGFTTKDVGAKFGINPLLVDDILNAAYDFDLRFISKLQSWRAEIEIEAAAIRVEKTGIRFPDYKDSYPIILNRLEKIVEKYEK